MAFLGIFSLAFRDPFRDIFVVAVETQTVLGRKGCAIHRVIAGDEAIELVSTMDSDRAPRAISNSGSLTSPWAYFSLLWVPQVKMVAIRKSCGPAAFTAPSTDSTAPRRAQQRSHSAISPPKNAMRIASGRLCTSSFSIILAR